MNLRRYQQRFAAEQAYSPGVSTGSVEQIPPLLPAPVLARASTVSRRASCQRCAS